MDKNEEVNKVDDENLDSPIHIWSEEFNTPPAENPFAKEPQFQDEEMQDEEKDELVKPSGDDFKPTEDQGTYCICHKPDNGETMIECDKCLNWYHIACLDMKHEDVSTQFREHVL